MPPTQPYERGQKILAKTGKSPLYYEAVITQVGAKRSGTKGYRIHYKGWHKRHDEFMSPADMEERTLPFSDAANEVALEAVAASKETNKRRRPSLNRSTAKVPTVKEECKETTSETKESEELTESTGTRGIKRKAEEAIEIEHKSTSLPTALKVVLALDFDLVNKQERLYNIPANHTVSEICQDYISELTTNENGNTLVLTEYDNDKRTKLSVDEITQHILGLETYFEVLLRNQLLYSNEHNQMAIWQNHLDASSSKRRLRSRAPVTTLSHLYGLPHLLRLLTRFEAALRQTNYPERDVNRVLSAISDFVVWLNKNYTKYYTGASDYEAAQTPIDT